MNDAVAVRPLDLDIEKDWVRSVLGDAFGSWRLNVQGKTLDASALQGFVAGKNDGLAQYRETDDNWLELVTLVSLDEGRGIGRSLIEEIQRHGHTGEHIGISVTNDNLRAWRSINEMAFISTTFAQEPSITRVTPRSCRFRPMPEMASELEMRSNYVSRSDVILLRLSFRSAMASLYAVSNC